MDPPDLPDFLLESLDSLDFLLKALESLDSLDFLLEASLRKCPWPM